MSFAEGFWEQFEGTGDLERLKMVLDALPDEELMLKLEAERKGRRDDYPIRAVWNSIISGVVFQHKSIESLRRELLRNGELQQVCGFEPIKGGDAVPSKDAYSELLKKLLKYQEDIDLMFDKVVEEIRQVLPDFGKNTAIDIARSSYKWARIYKSRTAVERVNSRLDGSFMFEHHFIRGQAKMKMRMGLALLVMVCMALARIRMNQRELMRSLVKDVPLLKEAA